MLAKEWRVAMAVQPVNMGMCAPPKKENSCHLMASFPSRHPIRPLICFSLLVVFRIIRRLLRPPLNHLRIPLQSLKRPHSNPQHSRKPKRNPKHVLGDLPHCHAGGGRNGELLGRAETCQDDRDQDYVEGLAVGFADVPVGGDTGEDGEQDAGLEGSEVKTASDQRIHGVSHRGHREFSGEDQTG
ncbi:hypothetical protein KC336_g54 [Hortaea werneckii]|nr:hypothetical protein KC336_g54 [Hortaea werneckii]